MRRIVIYFATQNERSKICAEAMRKGIERFEASVEFKHASTYRWPEHDVAVFYGLAGGLRQVFDDYRTRRRKAVYIDLGYWNRRKRTRFDGFHKITVNDRHPTEYFQKFKHPSDRFDAQGVRILPWRAGGDRIIVAGMSAKAALASGFMPHEWERATIAKLRTLTKRPIVYRPKPNWLGAQPIEGSIFMKEEPIEDVFRNAHCVVAHHSNVAVDAILAGIPAICTQGVASAFAAATLADLEALVLPDNRIQWAADIAYCQWSIEEMQKGVPWSHLTREGLIG